MMKTYSNLYWVTIDVLINDVLNIYLKCIYNLIIDKQESISLDLILMLFLHILYMFINILKSFKYRIFLHCIHYTSHT